MGSSSLLDQDFATVFNLLFNHYWRGKSNKAFYTNLEISKATFYKWIRGEHTPNEEEVILKIAKWLKLTEIETSALLLSAGQKAKHRPNEVQAHINQLLQQTTANPTIIEEEIEVIENTAESNQFNTTTTTNSQHISIQPSNTIVDSPIKPHRKRFHQSIAVISLIAIVFPLMIIMLPGINIIQGDNSQAGLVNVLEQHIQPTIQPTITPPPPITVALDRTNLSFEWTDSIENNKFIYGRIIARICATDPQKPLAYYIEAAEIAPNPKPIRDYSVQLTNQCQSYTIAPDVTPQDQILIGIAIFDSEQPHTSTIPLYSYLVTRNMSTNGLNVEQAATREYLLPAPFGCTDGPLHGDTIRGVFPVGGWMTVNDTNMIERVEMWVDGKHMGNAQYGLNHEPDLPTHGFMWDWDTTTITNGLHILQIKGIPMLGVEGFIACGNEPVEKHIMVENK
ncbi:hypothetical protein [Herpetosiphon sp. NSE202]|uniref:hypothetical protein n=1 Tax=Herpetosiphon sp. NSE202 TaxID=3351349 RepID=UPI00362D9447